MLILAGILLLASSTSADKRPEGVSCSSNDFQNFAYQVPKHACACNPKTAGTLRYHNNQIQFCNGWEYVDMGSGDRRIGSVNNPGKSCHDILSADKASKNGVYYLRLGDRLVRTYCLMDEVCGSRGWTMIMKVDGHKTTFKYDSVYWKNKDTYNRNGASGGLDNQETKLETYSDLPFNALCLGMKTGATTRWQKIPQKASSLYSLIADGKYRATRLGRNSWKNLVPGSSLQKNCNREGFNVHHVGASARIGIISNQENDCKSPDSRIGVGTQGAHCGQNNNNSAGNEARCSGDNGNKGIKSLGFIFAQ